MKRLLCMLLLLPGIACAKSFKCMDDGRVIYSATPCGENAQVLEYRSEQPTGTQKTLVLHLDAHRSFRVAGSVNAYPISFVVDTGASDTVISQSAAEAAGIRNCTNVGFSATANGVVKKCVTTVAEITFGKFQVKNLMVSILPNMEIDGLLGMDVLRRMKIQQQDGVMLISGQ